MKDLIKKILGSGVLKSLRPIYHGARGFLAAFRLGFPAKKLVIVGITGTKGKTTTTVFSGRLANLCGIKTGYISSALINEGDFDLENLNYDSLLEAESQNTKKMTTIDPVELQKTLAEMVSNGCQAVVLEMSSQGLEQQRHKGLSGFNIGVFLNLYPEHIEAHGSLEKYKHAKSILFQNLKPNGTFIAQDNSPETEFMYNHIPESIKATITKKSNSNLNANIIQNELGLYKQIVIDQQTYSTKVLSEFDANNLLTASLVVEGLPKFIKAPALVPSDIFNKFATISGVPGRMDFAIESGRVSGSELEIGHSEFSAISVMVDYAHEPESMEKLLTTLTKWKEQKFYDYIIHLVSSDGVGRDDWKKPILGELSYKYADVSIVTTDNYDSRDNPEDILTRLSEKLPKETENSKYFKIINRREAFKKALHLAVESHKQHVLIVSTGVGNEYGILQPGGLLDWNEKHIWQDEFTLFANQSAVIST